MKILCQWASVNFWFPISLTSSLLLAPLSQPINTTHALPVIEKVYSETAISTNTHYTQTADRRDPQTSRIGMAVASCVIDFTLVFSLYFWGCLSDFARRCHRRCVGCVAKGELFDCYHTPQYSLQGCRLEFHLPWERCDSWLVCLQ